MSGIGILAYGSLIIDPGPEIGPLIVRRITTVTPFVVEYARLSRTRGGAPTLVPHSSALPVKKVRYIPPPDHPWRRLRTGPQSPALERI